MNEKKQIVNRTSISTNGYSMLNKMCRLADVALAKLLDVLSNIKIRNNIL